MIAGNEVDDQPPTIDMGALARSLQPTPNASTVVLWWSVFILLVVACAYPNGLTVSLVCIYAAILVWRREQKRRVYFHNLDGLPCFSRAAGVPARTAWPALTVFVPARNEEQNLEAAARTLATLTYPNLRIWFINDHSTDGTPGILERVQRDFPQVNVLHDPPVTEGWFGKSNAIWQAFLEAEKVQRGGYVLFTDADVIFSGAILEQAVDYAERERLDYLTCIPRLIARTGAEQFLLPMGWKGIVQGAVPERLNDPKSFPVGMGAFMLMREDAYRAFGGHRALGAWHPEDTLMVAAVKQIGGRVGFAWTTDLLQVRFYEGYQAVKKNTLRKMRIFFGDHVHLPLTMMAMRLSTTLIALPMMVVGILPQVMAARFDVAHIALGIAGLAIYVDEVREYAEIDRIADFHRVIPWLHPVSGVLRVWFALSMIGQILGKTPMDWRGREDFGETVGGDGK